FNNDNNNSFAPSATTSNGDATGSNSFGKRFYWEYQAFLNYQKTIGKNHTITGTLGFTADHLRSDNFKISMQKYLNESIFTSNAAQIIDLTKTGSTATANADASFFGRLGYSFRGKYMAEGTWRRDGSSRFGIYNKWGNFFSGSGAWRFSEETFMSRFRNILDDGKLRFSVGQTGNDRIGDYGSYTLINFGNDDGNSGKTPEDAPGYYAGNAGAALGTTMGNSAIQWEATTQLDYGIDLVFFKGRMNFTADYYTKNTDQLLYNKQLPLETGAKSVTINLGTIVNSGLEFTLGGTPVTKKNFEWTVSGNISFQQGSIKSLANHVSFISGNKWLIREGGKIGDFYVYKNLGVYQYNESNAYDDNWNQLTPQFDAGGAFTGYLQNGKPYTGPVHSLYSSAGNKLKGGETIWQNTVKDSIIDDRDRVIAGNALPKYYFGFFNSFRYKNFTLSVLFNGSIGYQLYNKVRNDQNTFSSTYSPPIWDAILYSWQNPGDIAVYPDFRQIKKDVNGDVRSGMNSLYIEDASFIRLSSLRLTYALSAQTAKRFKMKGVSIYVFGDNLLTWTNY
ncbi:MAG TPA: TonB-dependent receptor, partial [Chitinophagaceae bacterium]